MVYQIFLNLIQWLTSLLWTSETISTVELGKSTGTSEGDLCDLSRKGTFRRKLKRQKRVRFDVGKPPLAPKGRKRRQMVPAVLYIDHNYWDARMTDVED